MPTYLENRRMPADLMTKTVPAPRLEELKVLVGLNDNASETKMNEVSDGEVLKVLEHELGLDAAWLKQASMNKVPSKLVAHINCLSLKEEASHSI
ncbi:hypothetical protein ABG067_004211 [Albugo candida]